jgi:hypothetical protein
VPLGKWLRGPLNGWAISRLRSGRLQSVGISEHVALDLMDEHCRHAADHTRTLWGLAVLDIWLETLVQAPLSMMAQGSAGTESNCGPDAPRGCSTGSRRPSADCAVS